MVDDDARATTLKPVRNPSTLSTPGHAPRLPVCCPINICHIMRKSIESFSTGQFSSSLSAPSSVLPIFLDLFSIKLPKVDNVFVSSAVGVMEAGQGRDN